jgi:hypothetical protein
LPKVPDPYTVSNVRAGVLAPYAEGVTPQVEPG